MIGFCATWDDASSPDLPLQNPLIDLTQPITIKFKLAIPSGCSMPLFDGNQDGCLDMQDFAELQRCATAGPMFDGEPSNVHPACICFDHDFNGAIDLTDRAAFHQCAGGPGVLVPPNCAP